MAAIESVESDLVSLIQQFCGSHAAIPKSASIYHDLHIAGDDAGELLTEISKRYNVKFDGFDFEPYFPNETESLWYYWASKFGFRDRNHIPITVEHLLSVIDRGKWFDPKKV
jgi:hypothetical protein